MGHAPRRRGHLGPPRRGQIAKPTWEVITSLVEQAIKHSADPDQGMWEIRGAPEYFTASKVLCWVAMDRGRNLARARADDGLAEHWSQAADELKAEILDKGVDEKGRFRQQYGNEELDASLLLIPILGFLPPTDQRVRNTVLAIADELTEDGLVLRYKVDTTDTGFKDKEGTFSICSFWPVTALP
jgi:alpha,alpha-trehalase